MSNKKIYPVRNRVRAIARTRGALGRAVSNGIYLDYAATTPMSAAALRAMRPYFSDKFGNPGSLHFFGQEAIKAVGDSREAIAKSIGAGFREIVFTSSATEANNLALRGTVQNVLCVLNVQDGNYNKRTGASDTTIRTVHPRVIVSAIEHESVLETALDLERHGVDVIYIPVDKNGLLDPEKIKKALTPQTVLVSVIYANNEVGTIQPIAKIAKVIANFRVQNALSVLNVQDGNYNKRAGTSDTTIRASTTMYPLFHADASQAFNLFDCDVNNLGVDLMTLSSHKIYGPKGAACLYIRKPSPSTYNLSPIITGGGQEFGLRSGTENVPAIVGFAAAITEAKQIRKREARRIKELAGYFMRGLKKIYPKAETNGLSWHHNRRSPHILSIYLPRRKAEEVLTALDLKGIAASSGSACRARSISPSHVLLAMGFSKSRAKSSLRISFGRFTSKKEIAAALEILGEII